METTFQIVNQPLFNFQIVNHPLFKLIWMLVRKLLDCRYFNILFHVYLQHYFTYIWIILFTGCSVNENLSTTIWYIFAKIWVKKKAGKVQKSCFQIWLHSNVSLTLQHFETDSEKAPDRNKPSLKPCYKSNIVQCPEDPSARFPNKGGNEFHSAQHLAASTNEPYWIKIGSTRFGGVQP